MRALLALCCIALTVTSSVSFAASISVLTGNTYKSFAGDTIEKDVITIDHWGEWAYGNIYFFYDISNGYEANDQSEFFGSVAPSFSLTKIFGWQKGSGILRDVLVRTELEHVSGASHVYYYGLTYDLAIPKFQLFNLSTVFRDDGNKPGVGGQLNGFWMLSFLKDFVFTGFFAAGVIPEHEDEFFLMTQPQLLYDVGKALDSQNKKGSTLVGIEYSYAVNRFLKRGMQDEFGNADAGFDEQVIQAMVKIVY